jgi:hypothetical protein
MPSFLKAASALLCLGAVFALGQDANPRTLDASPSAPPTVVQLSQELQQTRSDLADSKRQIEDLRRSLEELRKQVEAGHPPDAAPTEASEPTVAAADQAATFLAAKIAEIHQDKVESASKYPVKISGLVLFNSYWNRGIVDIQDLPNLALPNFPGAPNPGVGATLRQTMLGVEALGPKLFGAKTSADAEIDFAGGSPTTSFGVATGLLRLRTAKISLDWTNTSLSIGQENLFFSPLSPTSYATVYEPAMSWSGNLWVWAPGVELSHRVVLDDQSSLILQAGVLDPLTEEYPIFKAHEQPASETPRHPSAAQASHAPAIAGRIAFDRSKAGSYPFTIGLGGYRAQQQYQTFPAVASWTLNSDFKAGLGKYFELSGEWYRGQAVGGLGGGIWTSVVFPEPAGPHTAIQPLRSTGGWAQLKVIPVTRFEINAAFGQDENFGKDLRVFPFSFIGAGFPAMKKNRTDLVKCIYPPTSVLLLALEWRHLFTLPASSAGHSADQLNLAAGVHF